MLGLKIGLTVFASIILGFGIYQGVSKSNKVIMIFAILFSLALTIVSWLTIK